MISNEERWHVILFGENTPQANIIQLTKLFRLHGYTIPILMLTKQSEARVPRSLKKLGVDDMLNVAEIGTPLFSWTFMSTLKHAELRKKAEEFDVIRGRLQSADESLANITHEINNPLGVIKLALYHLENPNLESHKKEIFFKLLVANIEKVDIQMKELREVRRRLGDDTTTLAKIFSATSLQGAAEA
jgi:signal transduction histidine kinase